MVPGRPPEDSCRRWARWWRVSSSPSSSRRSSGIGRSVNGAHSIAQASAEHVEALKGQLIRSMEVLYAIESLFNAGKEISRREFRDFVGNTLARRPEMQGLAWDPRVPGSDRAEWEAQSARRTASTGFSSSSRQRTDCWFRPASVESIFPSFSWRTCRETSRRSGSTCGRKRSAGGAGAGARYRPGDRDAADPARPGARLAARLSRAAACLRSGPRRRSRSGGATCEGSPSRYTGSAISWTRRFERPCDRGLGVTVTDTEAGRGNLPARSRHAGRMPRVGTTIDVAGRPWTLRFEPSAAFAGSRFLWQAWASLAAGVDHHRPAVGVSLESRPASVRDGAADPEATVDLSAEIGERHARGAAAAVRAGRTGSARARPDCRTGGVQRALQAEVVHPTAGGSGGGDGQPGEVGIPREHEPRDPHAAQRHPRLLPRSSCATTPLDRSSAMPSRRSPAVPTTCCISSTRSSICRRSMPGGWRWCARSSTCGHCVHELAVMFQPLCEEKHLALRVEGLGPGHAIPVVGDARQAAAGAHQPARQRREVHRARRA